MARDARLEGEGGVRHRPSLKTAAPDFTWIDGQAHFLPGSGCSILDGPSKDLLFLVQGSIAPWKPIPQTNRFPVLPPVPHPEI